MAEAELNGLDGQLQLDVHKTENGTEDFSDSTKGYMTNEEFVKSQLLSVASTESPFVDLTNKTTLFPDLILNMHFIQFLYLSMNSLLSLPDDLFLCLDALRWLDLRCNKLTTLPSAGLSEHISIQCILLENNEITHLPLELGFAFTLRGLALSGNPLVFPIPEIVNQGLKEIQYHLQEVYDQRMKLERRGEQEQEQFEVKNEDTRQSPQFLHRQASSPTHLRLDSGDTTRTKSSKSIISSTTQERNFSNIDFEAPTQSALLHKPIAHYQIRQQHLKQSMSKRPAPRVLTRQSDKHNALVNPYPEPPPISAIEQKTIEEKKNNKRKEMLNKQEAILQRRRDAETNRKFKEETQQLQRVKAREQLMKSVSEINHESNQRITEAPFNAGYDPESLHLPSVQENDQYKWEGPKDDPKPQPMSLEEIKAVEKERRAKEAAIAKQIEMHTHAILERRKNPALSAAEELEAAKRDVQLLHHLRRSLFSPSGKISTLY